MMIEVNGFKNPGSIWFMKIYIDGSLIATVMGYTFADAAEKAHQVIIGKTGEVSR
jgi:hypothetical protein